MFRIGEVAMSDEELVRALEAGRMPAEGFPHAAHQFADANADLLRWKPSVLDRYYSPETLASDRARRTFLMPDLA
jgi:hypothetical protein